MYIVNIQLSDSRAINLSTAYPESAGSNVRPFKMTTPKTGKSLQHMALSQDVVPLREPVIGLSAKRVKPDWWIGKAPGAAFFGRSAKDIDQKFCRWRRSQYVETLRSIKPPPGSARAELVPELEA